MPPRRRKQGRGFSSRRILDRSKRQQSSGNSHEDPVLVDVEAVDEGKDDDVISDEVEEVNEEEVDVVNEKEGNQDDVIDEKDDYTDEGTDSDDVPFVPYSEAELRAFTEVIKTCGGNLNNFEKLGRKIKDTLYKEEQDEWSVWDASRKEGDTVLEVMTKMYGTQTRKNESSYS
jgi:hypothetical protein